MRSLKDGYVFHDPENKVNEQYVTLYSISDEVFFIPMKKHLEKYKLNSQSIRGTITQIHFTKAKVFYDIVDDYWGYLFERVDSINVGKDQIEQEL
jgi:hypothetical protein